MFSALHISIYSYPKALIQSIVGGVAIGRDDGTIRIAKLGRKQEDIGASIFSQSVQMLQNRLANFLCLVIRDEMRINVDGRTSLQLRKCQ